MKMVHRNAMKVNIDGIKRKSSFEIEDTFPDYMLDQRARQTIYKKKNRRDPLQFPDKNNDLLGSGDDRVPNNKQGRDKYSKGASISKEEDKALQANIRYAFGVATMMNNYNINDTHDIKEYTNNEISILTRKVPRIKECSQYPLLRKLSRKKSKKKSISGHQNSTGVSIHTLVVVNSERKPGLFKNEELLSQLLKNQLKPSNYLLSDEKNKSLLIETMNKGRNKQLKRTLDQIHVEPLNKCLFKNTDQMKLKEGQFELADFKRLKKKGYSSQFFGKEMFQTNKTKTKVQTKGRIPHYFQYTSQYTNSYDPRFGPNISKNFDN